MRFWLGSLFQTKAHSAARRLYFAVLRRFTAVFSKRQTVHFVRINGRLYKRVVLGDSFEAVQIENALRKVPDGARFPRLIQRHENELLLRFVDGRRFEAERRADRDALARFLGALYATARTGDAGDELAKQLEIDLDFLVDSGIIDQRLKQRLGDRAAAIRPGEIEYGLDYVDPVEKNFVVADDVLYAIDVESLRTGIPIGTGVAKAGIHWLSRAQLDAFCGDVESHSGDVFREQFPFVELCFRVGWTRRKLLQGKHAVIRVQRLDELLED